MNVIKALSYTEKLTAVFVGGFILMGALLLVEKNCK